MKYLLIVITIALIGCSKAKTECDTLADNPKLEGYNKHCLAANADLIAASIDQIEVNANIWTYMFNPKKVQMSCKHTLRLLEHCKEVK